MIQKETVYVPLKNQEATFESRFIMTVRGIYRIINGEGVTEQLANKKEGYFFTPEQLNEYTQSVIKQESVEFANWIAYTKKHGGVKPLQEALIQYKLKCTEELFDKYLEMSK